MKIVFRILALTACVFVLAGACMAQWVSCLNTMPNGGISSLGYDGTSLYAGRVQRIHVSYNQGITWTERDIGIFSNIFTIATSGSNVFIGTYGGGVMLSTNYGATWTAVNGSIPMPAGVPRIVVSGNTVFATVRNIQTGTSLGVFRSTNNGSSWTSVNTGLTTLEINGLLVNGTDLYAAGMNGTVFLSTDNGTSWTPRGTGMTTQTLGGLVMCGNTLFVAGTNAGVFRSTDKGATWSQATTGLTDWNFYGLLGCGTNLFAGTNKGVFLSTNNGASWDLANTGFTDKTAGPFVVTSTHIFAATETGVWKRPLSDFAAVTEVQKDVPYDFKLEQNYPNPFNPTTSFEFQVPSSGFVSLKVFNVLGIEVATLVNKECQPGLHKVKWDASGLPSSVYLCRLTAGNFTQTQRMILAK